MYGNSLQSHIKVIKIDSGLSIPAGSVAGSVRTVAERPLHTTSQGRCAMHCAIYCQTIPFRITGAKIWHRSVLPPVNYIRLLFVNVKVCASDPHHVLSNF